MNPDATPPTNVEIVVFVLADIAGGTDPVHLERIAVRAFEMAPGAFRWDLDEYVAFVDKDKVRVSLTDAQKDKHGGLVKAVGPKKRGVSKPADVWVLTPSGVTWVSEHGDRIADALDAARPGLKKGRAKAVRQQVSASDLYLQYQRTREITYNPYQFADLVRCSPDANVEVVDQRFQALQAEIRLLNDPEMSQFLDACARVHADMLTSAIEASREEETT